MSYIDNNDIKCEDVVKRLGIDIDFVLNFDQQITNMCKQEGHDGPYIAHLIGSRPF